MLKIGSQDISALYVGNAKIEKALVGTDVVYEDVPPLPTYTITAAVDPSGSGTASGAGTYQQGETVTLIASPEDGYQFTGWKESGVTVSTNAQYTFTVNGNRSLTAVFSVIIPTYTITTWVEPTGVGVITGYGTYQQGETVSLRATPGAGYQFAAWQENGVTVSTDAEYSFTVTGDRSLTGVFEAVKVSRLPEGYTELEWAQFGYKEATNYKYTYPGFVASLSNTGCVWSQVYAKLTYEFDLANYVKYSSNDIFYLWYTASSSAYYFIAFYPAQNVIKAQCGSNGTLKTLFSNVSTNGVASFKFVCGNFSSSGNNSIWLNEIKTSETMLYSPAYMGPSGFLFHNNASSSSTVAPYIRIKKIQQEYQNQYASEATIAQNNWELVPCIEKSTGIVGFYRLGGSTSTSYKRFIYPKLFNATYASDMIAGPAV